MDGQERWDRIVSAVLSVAMSGGAAWWLSRTVFSSGRPPNESVEETPLDVEFLGRPVAADTARVPLKQLRTERAHAELERAGFNVAGVSQAAASMDASTSHVSAVSAAGVDVPPHRDLHVHPNVALLPVRTEPFQRTPALEPQTTRFEAAWAPQADALQTASWRHPVLGVALHAFGGPPRHCTEVERRLLGPNCLPEPEGAAPIAEE